MNFKDFYVTIFGMFQYFLMGKENDHLGSHLTQASNNKCSGMLQSYNLKKYCFKRKEIQITQFLAFISKKTAMTYEASLLQLLDLFAKIHVVLLFLSFQFF